ncbi:uncharacterized protein LOC109826676 [Asparagus officinalis]|uniref:uncharacterized protein LOC109826676 n=1 Tax=Asparagus officinalis TaxID=4686 RepID=UPI00098E01A3|nr:uncharacterized protein LOC109826676 [Asparagus officinalis]
MMAAAAADEDQVESNVLGNEGDGRRRLERISGRMRWHPQFRISDGDGRSGGPNRHLTGWGGATTSRETEEASEGDGRGRAERISGRMRWNPSARRNPFVGLTRCRRRRRRRTKLRVTEEAYGVVRTESLTGIRWQLMSLSWIIASTILLDVRIAAWENAPRILGRVSAGSPLLPSSSTTRRTTTTPSSDREHPTDGASGDIEAGATEAAPEGKLRLKILLPLALGLIALASAVPFAVMSANIGGRMTRLSQVLTLSIALGIVFLCLVIIFLLYFWDMRCLHTATFICVMVTSLFVGLVVLATLAALRRF